MAMYIKEEDSRDDGIIWHVGDRLPEEMNSRMVEISVDGHEFLMLRKAMQEAYDKRVDARALAILEQSKLL